MKYKAIMTVQKQMSYRLQVAKKKRIDKTKKYQKEYHRKYYKEKQQQPYMCRICGKTLSDSSNIKRHEKSQRCAEAKNQCLVKLVLINIIWFNKN